MTEPCILALETATEACSVALKSRGEVFARHAVAPRQHAELTLPWVEVLCAEAGIERSQITHIAVGAGPGAFTGVRLAIALAQGLAFAHDLPMVAISTLQTVAAAVPAQPGQRICVAMDARMQEVYWCTFEIQDGVPVPLMEAAVSAPENVHLQGHGWLAAGTGFAAYEGRFKQLDAADVEIVDAHALPDARALLALAERAIERGETIAADAVEPVYLRNNVAQTIAERAALKPATP